MFLAPPAWSQYSILVRVRAKVTKLVQPHLVRKTFLVSSVDLTGLASSNKQEASKQQAHAKCEKIIAALWCLGFGKVLVHATYGCEGQPHKV